MNTKISNPILKQLISEIANKANQGRIENLNWGSIYESKKKGIKEADEKKPDASGEASSKEKEGGKLPPLGGETPSKPAAAEPTKGSELPPLGAKPKEEPKKDAAPSPKADQKPSSKPEDASGQDETEKAKKDAAKAKAELEKAKAEKAAAEKELEQNKYIKLSSPSGTRFLLSTIIEPKAEKNELDSVANTMRDALKIKTKEDAEAFKADMQQYMSIVGMPQLVDKLVASVPAQPEQPEAAPAP